MRKQKNSFARRVSALLGRSAFFWAIVGLLVIQAVWIALSSRYAMAFDEDFHLGIIRLYARHPSPFWSAQPAGADVYGAITRDPSYLYQYLMSFPYRLISLFTHDQTIQVLFLRAINIGLFAGGLAIFRRLLLKTGASRALVHGCLLIFVLLPVVPLLAAQINYDNLFIPLTALVLLITVNFIEELQAYKRVNSKLLLEILILCLLTSIVKYAFLPIFVAVVLYLIVKLWRSFPTRRKLLLSIGFGFTLMTRRTQWLLLILFILASGLFIQRDGINVVRYHTPAPSCDKVMSVKACSAYGPWIRDYNDEINKVSDAHSPIVFTADWFQGMWLRIFFAVSGPNTDFETKGPFVIPGFASIIFAGLGLVAVLGYGRRVFRRYNSSVLWFLIITASLYVLALWLDEYKAYVQTGQPVAINGRYLIPILPQVFVIVGLAFNEALKRRQNLKIGLAGIAILSLVWGGGALTYILRSNDNWYWPNQTVIDVNHAVQHVIGPITPGNNDPSQFLR